MGGSKSTPRIFRPHRPEDQVRIRSVGIPSPLLPSVGRRGAGRRRQAKPFGRLPPLGGGVTRSHGTQVGMVACVMRAVQGVVHQASVSLSPHLFLSSCKNESKFGSNKFYVTVAVIHLPMMLNKYSFSLLPTGRSTRVELPRKDYRSSAHLRVGVLTNMCDITHLPYLLNKKEHNHHR